MKTPLLSKPKKPKQCTHVKRNGARCGNAPTEGKKKCRFHGGAAGVGRPIIHGKYSKFLGTGEALKKYEEIVADDKLISLRETYAVLEMWKLEALEAVYDNQQSAELWKSAHQAYNDCVDALKNGDQEQFGISHQLLGNILKNGLRHEHAKDRFINMSEHQTKLQQAEIKHMQFRDNWVDPRTFNAMIMGFVHLVDLHVKDHNAIREIQSFISEAYNAASQQEAVGNSRSLGKRS